ncbi:hypothetical protein PFICI_03346 [Pestalotiopsis fici W106-1]|uniref:Uncharacterized protein n=1 Tax=Pestalotiopsis fici (strain W106-1 / CGMCC3.15140) TaxID=1229662 RepID=W3XJD6_PESFW|nr:uncharacterized protein PFICI_03346 [Pestalotiopsis fici W106-1]ETS85321.1 hypothetical protein PFICI_03346 [Pestalotiopsis fici W106-1]
MSADASNVKPQLNPLTSSTPGGSRSFRASEALNVSLPTSILDHITNAEDIFETSIFSSGSQVKVFQPTSERDNRSSGRLGQEPPEMAATALMLTVDELLARWNFAPYQENGSGITRQFPVLLGGTTDQEDNDKETFEISSDCCDKMFSGFSMHVPFLPSLWTTKTALGCRQWGHGLGNGLQGRVIDIWYTVPVSITVKGEGNFSLASSAIYSRYVIGTPQTSLVMVFLRYNWQRGSLHGRPTRDYEALMKKFKVPPRMSAAGDRAENGCQWHLGPQVAYVGMALGLWREGLGFLNAFAHDQEKKIHSELSDDRHETAINIRSIHLRLKFLHEEIESLQSICQTLDFLYNFWWTEATNQGEVQSISGVSTIEDLATLRQEFGIQMRSRDELVKRLSNVQTLVCQFSGVRFNF